MNHVELYLALIGIALVLFVFTRDKTKGEPKDKEEKNIQLAVDQFMDELTQENEKMMASIRLMQEDWKKEFRQIKQQLEEMEHRIMDLESTKQEKQTDRVPSHLLAKTPGFVISEQYQEVLDYYDKGYSPAQIAKTLGIGVGEVQLVLGLAGKEEAND